MAKEKEDKVKKGDIQETTEAVEAPASEDIEVKAVEFETIDAVEELIKEEVIEPEPEAAPKAERQAAQSSPDGTVTVQPVQFASFEDLNQTQGEANKNLEILMDIKLQLTVELGRTELPIKKVLELTRGSIIELEKVAGEPVELYANGKLVAHGEVVVIEDNFGLRITSITDPEERLKGV